MTSNELRKKFLEFFKAKDHVVIPSASLVPENDPTVLFTTAGMHPLVPFLLGEKHPGGKRLANVQICVRTDDIDEVGDETHHTFFEMLGNWSLGDYFKKEAIEWSYEFLTSKKWLGLDKEKLAVSFFKGDDDAPEDKESKEIWLNLGIPEKRIKGLSKKDNWWGPAGQTGPCGPDTEMFYWSGSELAPKEFNPQDKKWVEIWNDVFMQYFKNADGKYEPLAQKNIDTGMGLERVLSVISGFNDDYKTDVFWPIIGELEKSAGKKYEDNKREFRIIADHIKAAVFLANNGVIPGKNGREYVLRKLIRRARYYYDLLGAGDKNLAHLVEFIVPIYKDVYNELEENKNVIEKVITLEETIFLAHLEFGRRFLEKIFKTEGHISGENAFLLYSTYGFPFELVLDIAKENKIKVDMDKFFEKKKQHQELSRTASSGMFKGGLADTGEVAVRYHTATHLLLAALRQVLGPETYQKGSNITAERLRFDFNYSQKLTETQIKEVEDLVNQKIKEAIKIEMVEMPKNEAMKIAKISFDSSKYGDMVKVYKIGDFSIELCGGPHVKSTAELGHFEIVKEEASSSGVRRIRAILEDK